MLRITNLNTVGEQRWILSGQLSGPWVGEFQSNWEAARIDRGGRRCVVDLTQVTFIDESGESLLRAMCNEGVDFVAYGVDTRQLVKDLKNERRRPLRRCLEHLNCNRKG
jgi:anti-anti-sigma regulatory factor